MKRKSDLIIIASAKAQPGKEKDLEKALIEAAGPTRLQPGCVSFGLYRVSENPAIIVGFERWASPMAHEKHLQGAHIQRLMSAMTPVLAEPPQITSYEILDEQ